MRYFEVWQIKATKKIQLGFISMEENPIDWFKFLR